MIVKQVEGEYESPLVLAIKARERKTYLFRVNDFLGLPGPQVHHVKIRVATKAEEDAAVVAAHEYVKEAARNTDAKNDADLLTDAKTCHILHTVVRDSEVDGHAFLAAPWMREHFTTDHIAVLLNLYNEVRKKEGPQPTELSDEAIEGILRACAVFVEDGEAIPQQALAHCNRETLSEIVVAAAVKVMVARDEADRTQAIAKKQRERIAQLEAALKEASVAIPVEPVEPEPATEGESA